MLPALDAHRRRLESGRIQFAGVRREGARRRRKRWASRCSRPTPTRRRRWATRSNSLIARDAQAIWVGGDNTVTAAIDSVIAIGRAHARAGLHRAAGQARSRHALRRRPRFLRGRPPGRPARRRRARRRRHDEDSDPRRARDLVPPFLSVNTTVLEGLSERWHVPDDLLARANVVVDETGVHRRAAATAAAASAAHRPLSKQWRLSFIAVERRRSTSRKPSRACSRVSRTPGSSKAATTRRRPQRAGRHGDRERPDRCGGRRRRGPAHHVLDADAAGRAAAGQVDADRVQLRRRSPWRPAPGRATRARCRT